MRDKLDRYYTPDALALAVVDAMIEEIGAIPERVIEPSVGSGAFVRALRHRGHTGPIMGVDIDREAQGLGMVHVPLVGDWLGDLGGTRADLIVGNPPYNAAEAHIRASLDRAPMVLMLLRLSILGSEGRAKLWWAHPPRMMWTVVGRPSYTGDGKSDNVDALAVLWDRHWPRRFGSRMGWLRDPATYGTRARAWTVSPYGPDHD